MTGEALSLDSSLARYKAQLWRGGAWQVPGAHWQASLVKSLGSRSSGRSCLRKKGGEWLRINIKQHKCTHMNTQRDIPHTLPATYTGKITITYILAKVEQACIVFHFYLFIFVNWENIFYWLHWILQTLWKWHFKGCIANIYHIGLEMENSKQYRVIYVSSCSIRSASIHWVPTWSLSHCVFTMTHDTLIVTWP